MLGFQPCTFKIQAQTVTTALQSAVWILNEFKELNVKDNASLSDKKILQINFLSSALDTVSSQL